MRVKYTAKWGLQVAEMIFQTRSRAFRACTDFGSLLAKKICQQIVLPTDSVVFCYLYFFS
ncbi:MAG: DUF6783 domain-containing protein [Lachnospiraceae bacterium]